METVGFCKACADSLESYKKLKVSCLKAWKIRRESTNLVPVIVTPELKLFRIEEPLPYSTKKVPPASIRKAPMMGKKQPNQYTQEEADPLALQTKIKSPVKYVPYPMRTVHSAATTPSQELITKNYCYICKSIKSNLYKHLILAHSLIGKNLQKTCSECGLVCNDDMSFFRHFEHYHNERGIQRPSNTRIVKKTSVDSTQQG